MNQIDNRLADLCRRAEAEKDPKKLTEILTEINQLLDQYEHAKLPPVRKPANLAA